ncbi:ATP phosphoribosyltransferase regulatory subunit [Salibaculum halophilum]|uniref:ATP phosphoribosyltransferase regulatory subunit n=1 Tax=Salibaculum halophilum TaxID=1914408 RepID=UPI0024821045|nr:ATP phosphoribosyltransferase regulatory subunit [Salibaculum halophilum]
MTRSAHRAEGRAIGERCLSALRAAGAAPVDADILQPASVLLDLYGEDIRGRAYVTADPLRGELMLRPDFTVPIVRRHMDGGADPARYTYLGPVFRQQEADEARATESLQVGYELFDRDAPRADAEVFATIADLLGDAPLRAATGDIGILRAAVLGLNTTDRRKAALLRHLWRPRRFRQLLDRFGGRTPVPPARAALLAQADPMADLPPVMGKRTAAEIARRIDALQEDVAAAPISTTELELIDALLALSETCPNVLVALRDLSVDMPAIGAAVDGLSARLDALAARGVDVDALPFEGSYGRTSMEYYDGFVFGFYAESRPDLPPIATGGRYDALTAVLGGGRGVRAVGGVIRPELLAELEAGA